MATEKLVVELDASTESFDRKLKNSERRLDDVGESANDTSFSLDEFSSALKKGALGAAALAVSISFAIKEAADFAKELKIASNRTGDSVETLQAMAFAVGTVGISLEKMGDIGKDANEKIGEFLTTGGGGFKDFAEVLGLTELATLKAAKEFEKMSGTDVLQAMVTQMEEAGISAEKMSFALEGMASDTTDLLPLLIDGGSELKNLKDEFNELGIAISKADLDKIAKVGKELDKAASVFSAQSRQLIADYSEELIRGIEVVLSFAQKTTQTFNIITIGLGNLLAIAQAGFTDFVNDTNTLDEVLAERSALTREALSRLMGDDPGELGRKAGKEMAEGVNEGIDSVQGEVDSDAPQTKFEKELEAKKEKFDEALFQEEFENELSAIINANSLKFLEEELFQSQVSDLRDKAFEDDKKRQKKQADFDRKIELGKRRDLDGNFRAAQAVNTLLLDDNKAVAQGIIVAQAAVGITRQFADFPFPIAIGNSLVIAAMAAAQLSSAGSASRGGGSISVSAGSVSSASQDVQPETSTLELTEQSEEGVTVQRLIISLEDGSDIFDGLASGIAERERVGG